MKDLVDDFTWVSLAAAARKFHIPEATLREYASQNYFLSRGTGAALEIDEDGLRNWLWDEEEAAGGPEEGPCVLS